MVGRGFAWALLLALVAAVALQGCDTNSTPAFDYDALSLRTVGGRNTLDWRVWLEKNGKPISFWHDVVNFAVEITRWQDGKSRSAARSPKPIFHDDKNGKPRYVESVWPHKLYPFLYGSIPQTWETPNLDHDSTNEPGDNDPIDLFDIGQDIGFTGQVMILGALAPNDGGETDWKVLGIDVNDPIADLVDKFDDVEKYRPSLIHSYHDWFTSYKVARGDNVIPIVGESYVNATFAAAVEKGHKYWLDLIKGNVDSNEITYNQTSRPSIPHSYVPLGEATCRLDIPRKSDPSLLPLRPPASTRARPSTKGPWWRRPI
ncbi:inorganic pyrophosphatase [Aspergillus granulosus]|uniref:inorganic diphosphatase n=1 Tax=Aspergillus granulosus TaxID=176169 RepID=A0ABR4GU47_9EURO